jgi:hypothetical protein
MLSLFGAISAKPCFGVVAPLLYSSDYLIRKKAKFLNCNCARSPSLLGNSYDNYNLFLERTIFRNEINRSNLVYGLYSKENLKYAVTLANNTSPITPITPTQKVNPKNIPFYQYYIIDPKGTLFGNTPTPCGLNDFVNYMEPSIC